MTEGLLTYFFFGLTCLWILETDMLYRKYKTKRDALTILFALTLSPIFLAYKFVIFWINADDE